MTKEQERGKGATEHTSARIPILGNARLALPLLVLLLLAIPMAHASTLPVNFYLQNSSANPAITYPSQAGIPACANTLGGSCSGNDVISGVHSLNANLFIAGNFLLLGTLTTNGFYISTSQTLNTILGTINTGNFIGTGGVGGTGQNGQPSQNGGQGANAIGSYGGSGGGGGGGSSQSNCGSYCNGGQGGDSINVGGAGGATGNPGVGGSVGTSPSIPTVTGANMVTLCSSTFYLMGAGGGGGGAGTTLAAPGGAGATNMPYGLCLAANTLRLGTINAFGSSGTAGTPDVSDGYAGGGGGGSGGAVIILANGIGGYTAGTYNLNGGAGAAGGAGTSRNAGSGAAGGAGQVVRYNGINPFPLQTPAQYPFLFYTSDPTVTYTLNSVVAGVNTILQQGNSISYVPPSNQPTGKYNFNVVETNGISSYSFPINLSVNMQDLTSNLGSNYPCSNAIQYFPNCAVAPAFAATPTSWSIKSDVLANNHANSIVAGNNIDQWSNANLTFLPQVILSYGQFSPAIVFTANAVNNPAITSITQTQFKVYSQNTIPSPPYTRQIANLNSYDMQTQMRLNSSTYLSQSDIFNNYTFSNTTTPFIGNNFQIYMPSSNFQNPSITSTLTTYSLNNSRFSATNNYCPTVIGNGNVLSLNAYLAPASPTGSLYSFAITSGYNNAGVGDYMQIMSGVSPSTAILVQTYKIVSSTGFALALVNGGVYSFRFYNPNCGFVYATNYSSPTNPISIGIPLNQTVPIYTPSNIITSCVKTPTAPNTMQIACTGEDYNDKTGSWRLQLSNVSVTAGWMVVNTIWINGTNAFAYTYTSLNNHTAELVAITAYGYPFAITYPYTFNANALQTGFGVTTKAFLTLLFLLVGLGITAYGERSGAISDQHAMSTTLIIEAFMLAITWLIGLSTFFPIVGIVAMEILLIVVAVQAHRYEQGLY